MLLYPRNSAADQCKRLELQIDNNEPLGYFLCSDNQCTLSKYKLLSLYRNTICECGRRMDRRIQFSESNNPMVIADVRNRGVFVKGLARFITSDGLQVRPSSTEASLTVLSKLGHMDGSTIEECNIDIGVDEVLTLLKCSLVSETPLTETLLKRNLVHDLDKEDFDQGSYIPYIKSRIEEPASDVKINVKLIVSKSQQMVCYAEASEDFVDLLYSFLTVPLGYIVKEMHSSIPIGSVNHLYNSAQELDAQKCLKSDEHKAMLVSPKLAPDFSYKNHLLSIGEDSHPSYCYSELFHVKGVDHKLTSATNVPTGYHVQSSILTVKDPKSHFKETGMGEGFVTGPAMFTVTDNLIVTPVSQVSSLSLLGKLKVPFSDVEERVVQVGSEEALRLLVASFVAESALTIALLKEPNPEVKEEVSVL